MGLKWQRRTQTTIDLREFFPDLGLWRTPGGEPAVCPECFGEGSLDRTVIRPRRQYEHCERCARRWIRVFDDDGVRVAQVVR